MTDTTGVKSVRFALRGEQERARLFKANRQWTSLEASNRQIAGLQAALKALEARPSALRPARAAGESRPDVVAWQTDRSEWFMDDIIEIVTDYAAFRDTLAQPNAPEPKP